MTIGNERYYEEEKQKWDSLAESRFADDAALLLPPGEDFYTYCANSSVAVGVAEFLGDVSGKAVVEYGCGSGKTAALLARSGARVKAFDISPASVEAANRRAAVNNLPNLEAQVAVGERLPYEDESFDIAFGRAVLHHLDPAQAAPELARVLKPGGKACFIEPMGMNPVLKFVRDHVPYPNKNPVGDDKPLDYDDIHAWGAPLSRYHWQEVQLFSMLERAFPYRMNVSLPWLHAVDRAVMGAFPYVRRFARYVVLYIQK